MMVKFRIPTLITKSRIKYIDLIDFLTTET